MKLENKLEEIKKILDETIIRDFSENYNKSEIERILNCKKPNYMIVAENKIKAILNSIDIGFKNNYSINVTPSRVMINEIIEETLEYTQTRLKYEIKSNLTNHLPFAYVMGRKISKKNYLEAMEKLTNITKQQTF